MKRKLSLLFSALVLSLGLQASAQTSTWTIDSNHSEVGFVVRHGGVSNVRGTLGHVTGTILLDDKDITKSKVEATIDATAVSTGVDARDKHIKTPDFFDVAKYPTLTFKSTSVTRKDGQLLLIGDLTLHGVTKSVTFTVDGPSAPQKAMQGPGLVSGFSATGTLKRSDFGMSGYIPVVSDEVKFTIDLEIDKK